MMNKKFWLLILVAVGMIVFGTCSCLSSESKSEAESEAESTSEAVSEAESTAESESSVDIGNATAESSNELTNDLTASGSIDVKGVEVVVENETAPAPEPEFTFAQLFWNIYQDPFAKRAIVILVNCFLTIVVSAVVGGFIILFLWATGNLDPKEGFHLLGKKPDPDNTPTEVVVNNNQA